MRDGGRGKEMKRERRRKEGIDKIGKRQNRRERV